MHKVLASMEHSPCGKTLIGQCHCYQRALELDFMVRPLITYGIC